MQPNGRERLVKDMIRLNRLAGRAGDALRRLAPLRLVASWYARRPFVTSWALLAVGMVLAVAVFGRDVGLTAGQHIALAGVTIPLAWLCTWISFLEDGVPDATG